MNIAPFQWNDRYLTGISIIDSQHKNLVDIINRLGRVVLESDAEKLPRIVAEVVSYADLHFKCEERIWEKGIAEVAAVTLHHEKHGEFVTLLTRFQHDNVEHSVDDVLADATMLHRLLSSWLLYHILGDDQAMARRVLAQDNAAPVLPSGSEAVLLEAIHNLYASLTEMNQRLRDSNTQLEARVAERTRSLEQANSELRREHAELMQARFNLDEARARLFESERMASIGQLAAGVAHEINNPIGFVNSNLSSLGAYADDLIATLDIYATAEPLIARDPQMIAKIRDNQRERDIDFVRKDIRQLIGESRSGLDRVKRIVQDLKVFSHLDQSQWVKADLHTGLDSTIAIVMSQIRQKAELIRDYGVLPPVLCNPGQINQVFMNLLTNAEQAIDKIGIITVRSGTQAQEVWIEVEDTGCGIPPEQVERVFDPFFTTKPVGTGTGLGLSLAWSIVQSHGGRIEVRSTPGKGSCFRVYLPRDGKPPSQVATPETSQESVA
jgi:hemerythrin-like metal-binding protein